MRAWLDDADYDEGLLFAANGHARSWTRRARDSEARFEVEGADLALLPYSGATASPEETSTGVWEANRTALVYRIAHPARSAHSLTHRGVFIDAGRITDGRGGRTAPGGAERLSRPQRPLPGRHRGACETFRCGRASARSRSNSCATPRSRARPSAEPGIDLKGDNRMADEAERAIFNGWTSSICGLEPSGLGGRLSPVSHG